MAGGAASSGVRRQPRLRLAVVGLGYWGPNLVRVLHELPDAEVVSVCDLRPEALGEIRRRYPAVRTLKRYDDVLGDHSLDAVVIATPISTHYELARTALCAGLHVFVEKPLATSLEEASDLVAVAEREQRTLMPGHTFLYSPPVNLGRQLIQSGELGEIYFISMSRVNLGLHQSDASVVWDLGPHDFSILRYWLEETPIRVSALSRGCIIEGTPDVAFIDLEYASRTLAHVELSWLAPSKLRRTAIVGSHKMVVYDDTSPEPIRIFDSGADLCDPATFGEFRLTYRTGDIVSPRVQEREPLALQMADFLQAVRTGEDPVSSAEIGTDVLRVIAAVDSSLELGGYPVSVDTSPPELDAALAGHARKADGG
jgi:predicted dehydrogenase